MTSALKVLQIVHGFPPYDQAGTEVYTATLGRALLDRSEISQVSVFARKGDPASPEYEIEQKVKDGLNVFWINNNYKTIRKFEDLYLNPEIETQFDGLLDRLKPDVIHIQHLIGLSLGCASQALKTGAKVVLTLPDFWYQCPLGQRINKKLDRCDQVDIKKCFPCLCKKQLKFLSNAVIDQVLGRYEGKGLLGLPNVFARHLRDHTGVSPFKKRKEQMGALLNSMHAIIGPSQFILDEYEKFFDLKTRLIHSDYGMDQTWVKDLPEPIPSDKVRIGFIGSFIPSKGIELLIRAFDPIQRPDAELHLYGCAPSHMGYYEKELKAISQNPAVFFHGAFDNKDLASVLSRIDLLAVPSIWFENSPLTLHEAALANVPVLTTDLGGMREFVLRFKNGILFQPNDVEDLRKKMVQVLDNPAQLKELAQPKHQVKTPEEDAAQMVRLYQELIEESHG